MRNKQNNVLQSYWTCFGLYPSSCVWKTKYHNVSETGSVSVLRWMGQDKPTQLGPLMFCLFQELYISLSLCFIYFLLLPFILDPLACFPSELFWNYGSYRQSVGLLGRVIRPSQSRYIHTEQHKQRRNADRHPCLEWDSNP
jgi:hypothetical protein